MPIPLAIPLIAAGASLVGGLLQSRGSKKQTEATNKANKELAEYQYSKNLEMWERQNAYNAPTAQMQRYDDAGLNPNLIYGTGASAGNASNAPQYQAPRVDEHYQLPNYSAAPLTMLTAYQNLMMQQAQIDSVKAQTEATKQRTLNYAVTNSILQSELIPKEQRAQWVKENPHLFGEGLEITEYGLPTQRLYQEQIRFNQMNEMLKQMKEGTKQSEIKTETMSEELLFKKYENELRKLGVTSSDHPAMRMLAKMFNEFGINPFKFLSK